MARAKKNTVEYFPHNCTHGKTLRMFESKYDDGYKFWFKLLELLGKSPDHYYDCKNSLDRMWLSECCLGDPDKKKESMQMLDYLANLHAIDFDLWNNDAVIWCQNFVNNLEGVYSKRSTDIPTAPIRSGNPAQVSIPERIHLIPKHPVPKTPQSKLKESKENKIKLFLVAWNLYEKKQDKKKAH